MDEGLKGRKVLCALLFGTNPEIDFHAGWISLSSGKCTLHRIMHLTSFGITRPLHNHEVSRIILVKNLNILEHRRCSPACEVETGLGIKGIPVTGVSMLVDPRGNPPVLEGLLRSKAVKHDL